MLGRIKITVFIVSFFKVIDTTGKKYIFLDKAFIFKIQTRIQHSFKSAQATKKKAANQQRLIVFDILNKLLPYRRFCPSLVHHISIFLQNEIDDCPDSSEYGGTCVRVWAPIRLYIYYNI